MRARSAPRRSPFAADCIRRSNVLAIVTGASGGFGREFARLCAQAGMDCVLVARSREKLELLAAELSAAHGIKAEAFVLDLALPGAAHELYARFPACDVLINNAGFATNGRFDRFDERRMLEEIQVDIVALTQLTRLYLPGMRERKSGRVLNVASTAAFLPGPFMSVYYASKAYVLSLSEALHEESRGSGASVTCLCPGASETGFGERAQTGHTMLFGKLPLAKAGAVARAGFLGMMRGKAVVVPGITNKLVALSPHVTPRRLLLWMSRKAVE